jgi:Protein of unknown function (DUF3131)
MLWKGLTSDWLRSVSLTIIGIFASLSLSMCTSTPTASLPAKPVAQAIDCGAIASPLNPQEQEYARIAWQYFLNNYQSRTGLTNAADNYPSATLWDMGNYLTAINAARWLGMVDQQDFDYRINQFLTTLAELPLFEQALPNKVYKTDSVEMVDYKNQPTERGIGWSAIDMGRMLTSLQIVRSCHPQYSDWILGIVSSWQLGRSIQNGELYGAKLEPNGQVSILQEGRLGYEEYAARGYEQWGFDLSKAIALAPYKLVEVEGVKIPVDPRDYKSTHANNYVVSESYILESIEFGLPDELKPYAVNVLEAQKRRFEKTGYLTAVSEDNIDRDPYFLYSTVYANDAPWAVITDENRSHNNLRSLSTKAAFGWHYLYPDNAYAQKLLSQAAQLTDPKGRGFYAGLYETTKEANDILTGNTNGLILEILYYKARGNQPILANNN